MYVESKWGFKQVGACSIHICQGTNGDQCLEHFCFLRVEHPYIVGKSEKYLDVGEPTYHSKKTACYWLQVQTTVYISFNNANYSQKLHKKHSIRAAVHGIRRFHWTLHHQITECMLACPTPPVQYHKLLQAVYIVQVNSIGGVTTCTSTVHNQPANFWCHQASPCIPSGFGHRENTKLHSG